MKIKKGLRTKIFPLVLVGSLTGSIYMTKPVEKITSGLAEDDIICLDNGHAAIRSDLIRICIDDCEVIPYFVQMDITLSRINMKGYVRLEEILSGCTLLEENMDATFFEIQEKNEELEKKMTDFEKNRKIWTMLDFLKRYYPVTYYQPMKPYYTRVELREMVNEIEAILYQEKKDEKGKTR